MAEPTNPLFEQEKEFLERKKLEYERALRGDVEHIKDQTLNVGKLALIGAGAATGVWLLVKAFRGRKHKDESGHDDRDERSARNEYDRDGRYDQGYGMAYDEQADNPFLGYDDDDDERWTKHEPARFDDEADDNFDPHEAMARGVREYEREKTRDARRDPSLSASQRGDEDDNGLSQYPDFPAHSAPRHGENDAQSSEGFYFTDDDHFGYSEPAGRSAGAADQAVSLNSQPAGGRPFYHAEHSHPTANQANDDRRLPDSDGFQSLMPAQNQAATSPQAKPDKSGTLGAMLLNFATSETGRSLLGQAAAAGLALLGKAVKERMPEEPAETDKPSDLAA